MSIILKINENEIKGIYIRWNHISLENDFVSIPEGEYEVLSFNNNFVIFKATEKHQYLVKIKDYLLKLSQS